MKKTSLILIILCFLGAIPKSKAYSPAQRPFSELLNNYNQNDYVIIEGYFLPSTEGHYTSKLKVIRSSDSSIKIGQEYEVFEYGPFGSMCEMYEMKSNIEPEFAGEKNSRLLIVYKDRSINGKLVTPIFWQAGVNASDNKVVTKKYDYNSRQYISYECSTPLDEIWKQILAGSRITLEWKKQTNTTNAKQ